MKLSNFEDYIDEIILERGLKYFEGDHIERIQEIDDNRYVIEIVGTDFYKVGISLNEEEEVISTFCSCPFDFGPVCKHEAAALYGLREIRENNPAPKTKKKAKPKAEPKSNKEPDLKSTLSNLKKDQLVQVLMDLADDQPELEKKLLFEFAPAEDEIAQSKKLIREFINKAKHRGFIHWNDAGYALQGANATLDKANKRKESGDTESAVMLSLTVLSITIDMLQYTDDSSGDVGYCIHESKEIMEDAIAKGIDELSDKEQTKLFNTLLKAALQKRYDGWSDERVSLLGNCIYFARDPKRREKLEKQLDSLLQQSSGDSWSSNHLSEQVKLMQLSLIEQFDGADAAYAFITDNFEYPKLRERAILHHLEEENYHQVIELCKEGESRDSFFRGLVLRWQKYRLAAYEKLGDTPKVKELTRKFVLGGEFNYYLDLKKWYQADEFEQVLEEILAAFEKERHPSQTYVDILKEEKLYDKLLHYTKQRPWEIQTLYPYLIDDYFEEVNDIYQHFIKTEAEQATERKKYRKVCKLIKPYKKVFGETNTRKLINELEQKYQRRPAFMEELEKIK
ncbi:SWIM zinc finger family protein [Pseudalkalibacillus sp. R45]|uniref:SWIM zinc finger family protein n=1 Tax=Pseudalkalibacillus sp. R45 TaxID=3457433 RepID=UPI003FCD544C